MTDLETKRAQNAERQKRWRMRQKLRNAHEFSAKNAERQRRYRERQAAAQQAAFKLTPEQRILAYVTRHPGAPFMELSHALRDMSDSVFIPAVEALVNSGRLVCNRADQHRLTIA